MSILWANGQTGSSLSNIPSGIYSVTVTDAFGCTGTFSYNIQEPPALSITVQQVTDILCYGNATGSATLSANGGTGSYSWTWGGSTSVNNTISNVTAGIYTATVTDANGCTATQQINITEPQGPVLVQANINNTACGNQDGSISISVSGGVPPYSYQWNTGNNTSSVNNLTAGYYTVTVTDQNNCGIVQDYQVLASGAPSISITSQADASCFGISDGSATLSAVGGTQPYTWVWQGGVSSGSSAFGLQAGTYMVTVTDDTGCQAYAQVTISQPSALEIEVSGNDSICIGEAITISANVSGGVNPYSFVWDNGSTSSGINISPGITTTYQVTVTDGNGCSLSASPVTVFVFPALTLTALFPDSVCIGHSASIALNASGGNGVYNYTWSNSLSGSNNTITVAGDTSLTVILSDGCTTPQVQVQVQIQALEPPDFAITLPVESGCSPLSVQFSVPPLWPSGLIYLWDFGDGYQSTQPAPVHTYLVEGTYDVSLTIAYATAPDCEKTILFPQAVNVLASPVARFYFEPSVPTINQPEVSFRDLSTAAAFWWWDFGDQSPIARDQYPVHTYQDTGLYTVSLRVQSQNGCLDSVEHEVHVIDDMQVYVPNAFTPNNNGTNDYFNVYGVGFVSYELSIYNRWGQLVHFIKNREQGWDGTDMTSGKPVPQGVYVYKITLIDNQGKIHNRFNHVTVIR